MVDWLDKETRSRIMSSIRSRNTKPELALKKAVRGLGFAYQPKLIGSPDFVNRKKKIALYVHGCFWHKCPNCYREPTSNKKYWIPKLEKNVQRDKKNSKYLKGRGYKTLEIWECKIKKDINKVVKKIKKNFP